MRRELPQTSSSGIETITTKGYKSIFEERSLKVSPLTILAGTNSSGKSSIMQSLLLLKQTLEATYDPGPLLLNGPNVRFNSAEQLFSHLDKNRRAELLEISVATGEAAIKTCFTRKPALSVTQTTYQGKEGTSTLTADMTSAQIREEVPKELREFLKAITKDNDASLKIERNRCFLEPGVSGTIYRSLMALFGIVNNNEEAILKVIHLPGLRGNPKRAYQVSAIGSMFPGTFEVYTASVIAKWEAEKDQDKLLGIGNDLKRLGLTWKVASKVIDDTQVELQVGRLPQPAQGGAFDLVNIADVGFGVSQTLPVLVALRVAEPGQLVYLEQPEIHLHPSAQYQLAEILAEAAQRGVRLVVETHSHLVLLALQTLVAEQKLDPELIQLHWFTRNSDGVTEISSSRMDESGRYGDWPEDFCKTAMVAESRYLDSVI